MYKGNAKVWRSAMPLERWFSRSNLYFPILIVDFILQLALPPDLDNVAEQMATFWKARNLSST